MSLKTTTDSTQVRKDSRRDAALRIALTWICAAAAAASGPFNDQPDSPRSLPGDNLPPFGMQDARGDLVPTPPIPAGGLHRGLGSAPESSAPGPTLEQAMAAARVAVALCAAAGYRIGVAVVDSKGEARAMLTADGSDGSHVFVAMRKAEASVAFGLPSSIIQAHLAQDKTLQGKVRPYMFVEGGARPLLENDRVIGAIGVSGAGGTVIGQQDELCAAAGLNALTSLRMKARTRASASRTHSPAQNRP